MFIFKEPAMLVENITPKGEYNIKEYIATCSSVVRDKSPRSAEKLFDRLLVESIGDTASRVLEYIPCVINHNLMSDREQKYPMQLFGFILDNNYYTNARELLNWGWSLDKVLEYVDFTNYAVFKCEAPYFLYGQVSTHNQLTTVSHSQRYSKCDRGYWKPDEVSIPQDVWNIIVQTESPEVVSKTMKDFGVVRKEIFGRGIDMLQNRVFTIGGYTNNPNAWSHFINQRLDTHTQKETREFAQLIKDNI